MDFSKTIFQCFSILVFSFLGSGCKSRIVCRWRSRSYSGGDKSLTRLPPTPSTCLPKPKEKYTPACQSKSERQTSYLSFSAFIFLGRPLHARVVTRRYMFLHLSDCMACNQIFYFFIRICLFTVYLHFDAVFTVSHPLVVPIQAQR